VRLKRLELHGFKTFATRASLEFATGITAIVGPNGSGKSNVADAVRWVLGEQSLRLLRGRRTDDVIFAGGGGRASMGMAEVSLTLDNEDNRLGAEFSEVAISRRAYRAGENEYYINRARVRLRDVAAMLSAAGVGQNGHSVIGQGMVDLALSLRPEERRGLFEDAAGLRRYQVRKAEAEAKLGEVRANATRVADVIGELQSQTNLLRRQARRAQEEARLRQEWQEAMHAWLAQQRWELDETAAALAAAAEQLARREQEGEQEAARAAAALAHSRGELTAARAELARLRIERQAAQEAVDTARRNAAVHAERRAAAARAAAESGASVNRQRARLHAAEAAVPAARRAREAAELARNAAQDAAAAAREALRAEEQRGRAGEDEMRRARAEAVEAAQAGAQAATQLQEADRRLEELQRQSAEAAVGRQRVEASLEGVAGRLAALQDAAHRRAKARAALLTEQAAAREALAQAADVAARLRAGLAALEQEIEALAVRRAVLVDVAGSSGAGGDHGGDGGAPAAGPTLARLLPADARSESAVAAALGDRLEWIVVDTPERAAELALAQAQNGDRRTYVARGDLFRSRRPPPAVPTREGTIGYLSETVAGSDGAPVSAEGQALLDALLGNAYLVRDLRVALDLARTLNGAPRPNLVTLAGEAVDACGAVTAGAPPAEAATLTRLREIQELEAALTAVRGRRTPAARAEEEARGRREARLAEEQRIEAELRALAQAASRDEGERRGLAQQAARLEKDLEWWTEYVQRTTRQRADLDERRRALLQRCEAAQATDTAARGRAEQLAAGWREREATLAELREAATEARTAAAVAEQQLTQATHRLAAAESDAQAARQSLDGAQERLTAAEHESQQLEAEVQEMAHRLRQEEAHLSTASGTAAALERSAGALEGEVERWRTRVETVQATLAQVARERAVLDAQETTLGERRRMLHDVAARDLGELPQAQRSQAATAELAAAVERLQGQLRALGPVNQVAMQEHAEASERLSFLRGQLADLEAAMASLEAVKAELERGLEGDFGTTFAAVAELFRVYFKRFFGGGDAQLMLTDPGNLAGTGVDIVAQLPGKKRQELALLSGGERALVAAALLFALLKARPSPFCVLDEVDAALDEANVGRFCDALEELSAETQFVLITHNRATMERAGALYGVTLGSDNVSRVLSLRLAELPAWERAN
jgi:chromosome segregation protein